MGEKSQNSVIIFAECCHNVITAASSPTVFQLVFDRVE